ESQDGFPLNGYNQGQGNSRFPGDGRANHQGSRLFYFLQATEMSEWWKTCLRTSNRTNQQEKGKIRNGSDHHGSWCVRAFWQSGCREQDRRGHARAAACVPRSSVGPVGQERNARLGTSLDEIVIFDAGHPAPGSSIL